MPTRILAPPEKIARLKELQAEVRRLEDARRRRAARKWETAGDLAAAIDPDTVQTPALDVIDQALLWAYSTPDARLLISLPPQEGKSSRVTKTGSLWALTRNPETRIGIASYAQSLAEGFGRDVRNTISTFNGDEGTLDLGLRIAPDYGSARRWQLDGHRGGVVTVGIGSGLTGRPLDCFAGSTEILTDRGYIRIRDIYQSERPVNVLSWNHSAGRAEWKPVVAARRIPGREVVEVVTTGGRRFTCTPDHLIYTAGGRGYVPAAGIRPGDWLIAASAGSGAVQSLRHSGREAKVGSAGQAGDAAVLLETMPVQRGPRIANVRALRRGLYAPPMRSRESRPAGFHPLVLLEDLLRRGRVRTACREATVRNVRQAEAAQERTPGGAFLLRRVPGALLRSVRGLRPLRNILRDATVRTGEEAQARREAVLLAAMRFGRRRGDAHEGQMPGMRRDDATALEWAQILHARLSRFASGADAEVAGSGVHGMRSTVPAQAEPDSVLFTGLRQQGALAADDRHWQLALSDGYQLRGLVPQDAPPDPRAGRQRVRGMQEVPASDAVPAQGRPSRAQFAAGAPHQRDSSGQLARELDRSLQDMPCDPPQVEYDAVSVVRRIRGARHDVYDIQVAGNCNFFAGEILAHNCLVIDDPFADAEQAGSAYYRDRVWDWWQSVGAPRLAPGAPAIVILTRWHEDDLAGRLQAAEDGSRWRVINIPALADHDPAKGQSDPLGREPGEWLQSARGRTPGEWEQIRIQAGSRVFAALYQGRPSPDQGNVWQRQWWRRYYEPIWSQHPDVPGASRVNEYDEMVMSWDMAFKDTKSSDFVVGQVWARRDADVFLLDQIRKRLSFTDTLAAFTAMCAKWPQATRKLVEDKANGSAVISTLRSKIPGIVPVNPTDSKYGRATAVAPFIEAGNVFLPVPDIATFDTEAYVDETAGFPNGAHDDQVDATSQALAEMLLDGTGAQAWIAWARRKAEAAGEDPVVAARTVAPADPPTAQTRTDTPGQPLTDAETRRQSRDAAFRAQRETAR